MNVFEKNSALKLLKKLSKKTTDKDVEKIEKKLPSMNRGIIAGIWDKVLALFEAMKNPEVSLSRKAMIIGGLLYLILPVDVVPDFIPFGGFLDDVFVILFVCKQALEIASEAVIEKIKAPVDEIIKEKIDEKLNQMLKTTVICAVTSSLLVFSGIFLVIFMPFGKEISYYAAAVIFILFFGFMIFRFMRNLKNALPWIKSIFKEKNIKKGILAEIKNQNKTIAVYDTVLEKGAKIFPSLEEIPNLERILDHYVRFFRKKVLIFLIAIALYFLAVNFILKPFLITSFSDLKYWEIYLYPIVHISESLKSLLNLHP
ncbi:MAG: YkvA family protein [Treponema sp.]